MAETAGMLVVDRLTFAGAWLGTMTYGFHVILAYLCIRALLARKAKELRWTPRTLFLLAFVAVQFILGTTNIFSQYSFYVQAFVDNRMFPTGPTAWLSARADILASQLSNGCCIAATFLADGLLLWRTFVVWRSSYRLIALPLILYVAVTGMSVTAMYGVAHPEVQALSATANGTVYVIYGAMSISLTVGLTSLIAGRLLYVSRRSKKTFGSESEYGQGYVSAAALVVESALPYAIIALAFVIAFSQSVNGSQFLFPILSQVMCISPEMIIWKVACGQAYAETPLPTSSRSSPPRSDDNTGVRLGSLVFARSQASVDDQGEMSPSNLSTEPKPKRSAATLSRV